MTVLLKKCSHCHDIKSINDFYKSRRDGLNCWCKNCCKIKVINRKTTPKRIFKDNQELKLKECSKCNTVCSYSEFSINRRRRYGKSRYKCYSQNPGRSREQREKYRKRNCTQWILYLESKYGKNPNCECCGKKLGFSLGLSQKSQTVHFDHRNNGKEMIQNGPNSWIMNHAHNNKNIKIFESCNFGILCHQCNILLPTKNRIQWLEMAYDYVKQTKISSNTFV
mgnify:CR=1 FL=1